MTYQDLSVLVCDDSLIIRKKMSDLLEKLGVGKIYLAVNGQEAIDKYKEFSPTVVFLDVVMPIKTGVEAVAEIKQFDKNAKLVMASSVGTQSHLKAAIDAGAFEFLQKPVADDQIKKILDLFI